MSDDGCYCEISEGEDPSFIYEQWRTAAKNHKCCECRDVISKGETYHVTSGRWDDSMKSFKTCAYCARLRIAARAHGFEGCFGDLGCYLTSYPDLEPAQLERTK